jgi:Protein of unknown function (DUF1579)
MELETTETKAKAPMPDAALRKLDVFVGKWTSEGRQHEGLVGPAAKIIAAESYDWLKGDFFLIHRFDGRVGEGEAACIEIIGYDPEGDLYPVHTFYNTGVTTKWEYRERDGAWTLTGGWDMGGKPMKVRATVTFSDGGQTMTGKWEHSTDGSDWQTFWEVKATKTPANAAH